MAILFRGKTTLYGSWVEGDLIQNPESEYPEIGLFVNYLGDGREEPPYSSYDLFDVIPKTVEIKINDTWIKLTELENYKLVKVQ